MLPSVFSSKEIHEEHKEFRKFTSTSENVINMNKKPTDIQRFYSGASVLVTGATGFMGKVLIEKLLRSCPDIDRVYMLVREKKGRSLDERIDDLVSSPCFERIKRERPEFRSSLHAVAGDIALEGLGLSPEDRHSLKQQVNIVLHVAATVRFDEPLKDAVLLNVRGTREVLDLCRTFSNLKSVVHVSTAYSNCPETQIDERFYDPLWPSDHVIRLAETTDVTTLDRLSHKLLGNWPNTYSFTKALSEDVVRNHGQGLPIAVFRPSMVLCTNSEPAAGWMDNLYGPTGVLFGCSVGLLRTMQTTVDDEANLVPCDLAINALIASAWDVAENRSAEETPVYNYVSTRDNPITWKMFSDFFFLNRELYQPSQAVWVSTIVYFETRVLYLVFRFLVHILPALFVDAFLLATNRSPMMVKTYRKLHRFMDVVSYFTTRQWHFEDQHVQRMWKDMHTNDKQLFLFDMNSLDWYRYIKNSCPGLRLYLLKDPMETLPAAKAKLQKLKVLHYSLLSVLALIFIWTSGLILPLLWTALRSLVHHTVVYLFIAPVQRFLPSFT